MLSRLAPRASRLPLPFTRTHAVHRCHSQATRQVISYSRREEPHEPDLKPHEPSSNEDQYNVNLGRVMEELPHQLESFFVNGLVPGIYHEQIRFRDPNHSGMQLTGHSQYMGMARLLRLALNAYFAHPTLTIVVLRQVPSSNSTADSKSKLDLSVRWVFEALPRHSDLIASGSPPSRYEGEFRYAIHPASGLIAEHELAAIHPTPPAAVFASAGLARWASCLAPRGSLSMSKND